MFADRLKPGDEIRVIAPSESLTVIWPDAYDRAVRFLEGEGFRLTFGAHAREVERFDSASLADRLDDLHAAFADPNVKLILTAIGGFNSNHLLRRMDYDLIARNPKLLCGFSDITALLNGIYAKTGLVTYCGPHFATFAKEYQREYTKQALYNCMMTSDPMPLPPSPAQGRYVAVQTGVCEGIAVGGNLCTFNLLQGTPYMPDLTDKILFIEDDNIMGDVFRQEFDRNLESVLQTYNADKLRAIVLGRFDGCCKMDPYITREMFRGMVPENIPVIFGADFGHVEPMATFPIGGKIRIEATETEVKMDILTH